MVYAVMASWQCVQRHAGQKARAVMPAHTGEQPQSQCNYRRRRCGPKPLASWDSRAARGPKVQDRPRHTCAIRSSLPTTSPFAAISAQRMSSARRCSCTSTSSRRNSRRPQVEPERAEADLLIIHRIRHSRETADLRPLNKDLKSAPALMSSIEISVSVTH